LTVVTQYPAMQFLAATTKTKQIDNDSEPKTAFFNKTNQNRTKHQKKTILTRHSTN